MKGGNGHPDIDTVKGTCFHDFLKRFAGETDHENVSVTVDHAGYDEIILVESETKRAVYNRFGELLKVINKGEEE
jgi:hypothetical protein